VPDAQNTASTTEAIEAALTAYGKEPGAVLPVQVLDAAWQELERLRSHMERLEQELGALRWERDREVTDVQRARDTYARRFGETLAERDDLKNQLAKAEQERDEARRALREIADTPASHDEGRIMRTLALASLDQEEAIALRQERDEAREAARKWQREAQAAGKGRGAR
jgi:SMC interacting uncharacterized protein involved in chromosome segregation